MSQRPRAPVACILVAYALAACGGSVSRGGTEAGRGPDADGAGQGGGSVSQQGTEAGRGPDADGAGQGGGSSVSGQGGASAVDAGAVDVPTACSLFTDAYCALTLKCEPFAAAVEFDSDPQRCEDETRRWCALSIEAKGSNTTPQWFADVAAKLRALSCTELLYTGARYPTYGLPPGVRADGAPCVAGAQCGSGECEYQFGDPCGTCYKLAKGAACQSDGECAPFYRCIAGTCALGAEIGHACSAQSPCMQGLTCTGGVCRITPPGGSCPTGWECGGEIDGEFCNGGLCQPTSPGQPGAACSGAGYCVGGGFCSGTTCPPLPVPAGGACKATSDCEFLTYCVSGICTEVPNDCP